jgi:zinc transporter ZupT
MLGGASLGVHPLAVALAFGFGTYLLIAQGVCGTRSEMTRWRHDLAPAMLTLHSLIDGLGIGVAFGLNTRAGWLIALAVVTHDLADGVNTVSVSLTDQDRRRARLWLTANSIAPVVGVLMGQRLQLDAEALALLLAAFAGIFLYIGACELLPHSRELEPGLGSAAASLAGMTLMAIVTGLAS